MMDTFKRKKQRRKRNYVLTRERARLDVTYT